MVCTPSRGNELSQLGICAGAPSFRSRAKGGLVQRVLTWMTSKYRVPGSVSTTARRCGGRAKGTERYETVPSVFVTRSVRSILPPDAWVPEERLQPDTT